MNPTALVCRDLRVSYGKSEVLGGVDLDVAVGEWLSIIGPNGAGKSTLLRAIAGLIPSSGTITFSESAKNGEAPSPGRHIALVPQSPILPEGMTVAEYVLLGRTAHLGWLAGESKHDRDVVAAVLIRLDIERFASRSVHHLSGGEAQRVVVGRALAQEAPVLLLDEPTSALDLGHQVAMLELLDDLRRSDGLTILSAMHDLTTAARFADRLALVQAGRLVAHGDAASVLEPQRLSEIYETPLTVRRIDGELVVLPGPRSNQNGAAYRKETA